MSLDLKLGDLVLIGADTYVVATVTGLPPSYWSLVQVPAGKAPLDLGKTWKRTESTELSLIAPAKPTPSASLDTLTPPATPEDA